MDKGIQKWPQWHLKNKQVSIRISSLGVLEKNIRIFFSNQDHTLSSCPLVIECPNTGVSYKGACEIRSEKCARCACVRLVFGRAMRDRAFAHFLVTKWTENAILELPILFKNILFCFRTSFPTLEHHKKC